MKKGGIGKRKEEREENRTKKEMEQNRRKVLRSAGRCMSKREIQKEGKIIKYGMHMKV